MISQSPQGLMSQTEYAEHRKLKKLKGGTRQAVNKKVKTGQIPTHIVDGVAYIDPLEADAAWDANCARPGPEHAREVRDDGLARENVTLTKVHIKKEGIKALKEQITLDLMKGTVVKREAVERAAFSAMRTTRDQLMGMGAKLAPALAHAQNPQEAAAIVNVEVREILAELARKFRGVPDAGRSTGPGDQPAA